MKRKRDTGKGIKNLALGGTNWDIHEMEMLHDKQ